MKFFIIVFLFYFSSHVYSEKQIPSSDFDKWNKYPYRKHSFLCQKGNKNPKRHLFTLIEFYNAGNGVSPNNETENLKLEIPPSCLLTQNGTQNLISYEKNTDIKTSCSHQLIKELDFFTAQGYHCQDWGFLPSRPERYRHQPEILNWLFKETPIDLSTVQILEKIADEEIIQKIDTENIKEEAASDTLHGNNQGSFIKITGILNNEDPKFDTIMMHLTDGHLKNKDPVLASRLQEIIKPLWEKHYLTINNLMEEYLEEQESLCMSDTQDLLNAFNNDKDSFACFGQQLTLENETVCGEELHYLNFRITKLMVALEAFEKIEETIADTLSFDEKDLVKRRRPQ